MSHSSSPALGSAGATGCALTSSCRRAIPVSLDTGIASRRENLSPLYLAGLWLAVTWIPADARRCPVAK